MFNKCRQALLSVLSMLSEAATVVAVGTAGNRWKFSLWSPFFHQQQALFPSQLLRPENHAPLKRIRATPKSCPHRLLQNPRACTQFLCLAASYTPGKSHLCFPHAHLLSGFSLNRTPFPTLPTLQGLKFKDSDQTSAPKRLS